MSKKIQSMKIEVTKENVPGEWVSKGEYDVTVGKKAYYFTNTKTNGQTSVTLYNMKRFLSDGTFLIIA